MGQYFKVVPGRSINTHQAFGEIYLLNNDGTPWNPDEPARLVESLEAEASPFKAALNSLAPLDSLRAETMRLAFAPPPPQDFPTVTVIGTAASTMTGTVLREKRIGDNTANGADLAADPRFRYSGTPSLDPTPADPTNFVQAPLIPGGASQSAYYAFAVETITASTNSEIEFRFRAPATGVSYRLQVDGRHYSMEVIRATGLAPGSWYYIRMAFPVARSRHIRLTLEGNVAFSGAKVPTGQELVRSPRPPAFPVAIIGDSFEGGAGLRPDGATRMETASYLAALAMGADSITHLGLGGTGYTTANPYADRVAAAVAAAPQAVIVGGSRNDGTADTAGLRAAVDTVLAGLASVPAVYVTGPSTVTFAGNNAAVKARTLAAGRGFVDALEDPWINTATMIGGDGIHLNWIGHQRRASRLHEAITALRAP